MKKAWVTFLVSLTVGLGLGVAFADTITTAGARVLENPALDGNFVLRVNDGGVKTDALTVTGSTSVVSLAQPLPVASGGSGSASGVTSTAIVDGTIVSADINASAAIPYSKLTFSNNIVAGDIATSAVGTAEIADGVIVDADISASASIDGTKIDAASGSVAGVVSTGTQTFTGSKTFNNTVTMPAIVLTSTSTSPSAPGALVTYWRLNVNGTIYKIALLGDN